MKQASTLHLYVFIMVVATGGLAFAQEAPLNTSPADRDSKGSPGCIERLQSDDNRTRRAAAKEISDYRRETIKKLVGIVAADANEQAKVEAIHLLGEYRAKEAVSVLLDNFRTGWTIHKGLVSDAELMPAGDALVQIGEPSVLAILSKVATTDDKDTQSTYMYVLRRIEPDKQILQLRIQKTLGQETVEHRKANLQKAIDDLKASK